MTKFVPLKLKGESAERILLAIDIIFCHRMQDNLRYELQGFSALNKLEKICQLNDWQELESELNDEWKLRGYFELNFSELLWIEQYIDGN
jgi:hypothetical protein